MLMSLLRAFTDSPLGQYVLESAWAFPTFESIHVIAITTVIGTVLIMDLRLLGWAGIGSKVTQVSHDTLRWTWAAFALAVVTGLLLFSSRAPDYTVNPYFDAKMILMGLAGLNMAVFHLITWRNVRVWDVGSPVPMSAKIAGGLSLAFWVGVVFMARVVGFTLDKFTAS